MGDLTNEDFNFIRAGLVLTERSGIHLTKREVRGLLDMAERCAKAEKAAGELLRACTTAQRILAEYGEDNREIDEAIARAQSGQPAQRDDDKCEKPDQCEGGHDVPGIAFSGDDVWLCKECLEACDSIESRGGQP